MTDEEIINNGLENDNSENQRESSTIQIIRTVRHDDTMSAFNKCYINGKGKKNVKLSPYLPN
jgi:hypothetical protein